MPNHVLHDDDPRVNRRADGQGNPAQGHHVDRVPGEVKPQAADEHRQHDHGENRQRRQQTPEKHRDHNRHQNRPQAHFVNQVSHRVSDIGRLVADQGDFGGFGDFAAGLHRGDFFGEPFVDAIHDGDRVFARLAEQRAIHAPAAVDADDVVLNRGIVLYVAHIANEDRFAVADRDRDGFDVFGRGQGVRGMHLIFVIPQLRGAGGEDEIRLAHGFDHVGGAQIDGPEPGGIDIDHHLPELPAEGVRNLHALKSAHFVADGVIADFVEFRLAQALAGNRRQNHRQVRRFAAEREGMFDARRQMEEIVVFQVHDVVHRRPRIGPRLKEHLDHCRSGNRSRFLVLHAARERQEPLDSLRNAFLHVPRRQTGIGEIADHDRFLEVRQNVHRYRRHHRQTQQAKPHADRDDRIGIPQCKTNQTHLIQFTSNRRRQGKFFGFQFLASRAA